MTMDEPATTAIRSMLVQAEFMRPWLYQNMMVFRRLGTQ